MSHVIKFLCMRSLKPTGDKPLGVSYTDSGLAQKEAYWARIAKVLTSGQRVVARVEQRK